MTRKKAKTRSKILQPGRAFLKRYNRANNQRTRASHIKIYEKKDQPVKPKRIN